ncbi:pyrophosphatase PpaX [Aureibacillus halotolerans]|uniref:Pyrophosphatase PpaX n=1 Tax=Aureibacillus halotolerans TaxID=1508390 RepID=A0A4R6TYF9_9BACI|nr:pyrophosphatase PpaX [Aureibacillus halotolerans]TDQ36965.1 pyrophosphatase PpaX [Aureibacillus halotolerans]
MSIKTFLFDLDGTLINTNDLIIASFMHTLERYYPGQYTEKDVLDFMGPPLVDSFKALDGERYEEMVQTYRTHNLDHHDTLVTPFVGVKEAVIALHEKGVQLAVVTTKMKETAIRGLRLMGLEEYFSVVIALDDVTNAKPDPEPVLKAMEALGATTDETIMVGDNMHDIESGKRAGVKTACVSWTIKDQTYLKSYAPDYWLEDMSELVPLAD